MSAAPKFASSLVEPNQEISVLLGLSVPIAIIDENGRIVGANSAIGVLSDRDVQELCAMDLKALIWGQDFDLYKNWLSSFATEQSTDQLECRLLLPSGERIWVRLQPSPLGNQDAPRLFGVHMEDVSETLESRELRKYQSELNRILTNISCDYQQVHTDDFDLWVTQSLGQIAEFIGADRSYLLAVSPDGQTISNTHEWCAPGIEPAIDLLQNIPLEAFPWMVPCLQAGQPLNFADLADLPEEASLERMVLEAQGIKSIACLPLISGGRFVGFTGFDAVREAREWPEEAILLLRSGSSLITSAMLHRLGSALQESEERYRSVVDDVRSIIFRTDAEGAWTFLSSAWEELSDESIDESLGTSALELIHPDDRPLAEQMMRTVISGDQEVRRFEARAVIHGEMRWLGILSRSIWDSQGELAGYAGVIEDITDRKTAELQALQARKEAEEARDAAEHASKAKSEFLSRMSHELRTPMNAIIGFSQLLELTELEDEARENVSHIVHAGNHLLELINEVLDVVRIESGHLSLSLESVEILQLIKESLNLVGPSVAQRNLRVVTSLGVLRSLWVHADRQRLTQVLVNLLSNAVKYNTDGGTVKVSCSRLDRGMVRIEVSDTGIGIAPDRIEDVFAPFERLGAERTTIEGTGMGLTVTKRLVEAMNGTIDATSTQGVGTCFTVDIPVAQHRKEEQFEEPLASEPGHEHALPPEPDALVLYVEDNPSNATLVRRVLAYRPNVELLVAAEGSVGLEFAKEVRPQLILLDLNLPDINGAEVLEILLSDPVTKEIPVIIVSADASADRARRLVEMGASDYVTKPIDIKNFLATIDKFVSKAMKAS